MKDPVRLRDLGDGEVPDELRTLVRAAQPLRHRSAESRAQGVAFVAGLAKKKKSAGLFLEWVFAFRMAAAFCCLVLFGFVGGDLTNVVEEEAVVIAAEPVAPVEPEGFAWFDPSFRPVSMEREGAAGDTPGYGDVCGATVCGKDPACCEGGWDAHCDAILLEISRSGFGITTNVGRCSWHGRESCPNCACPLYLKHIEDREAGIQLGFDGGTGCLKDAARLLGELRWMCMQGYCEE